MSPLPPLSVFCCAVLSSPPRGSPAPSPKVMSVYAPHCMLLVVLTGDLWCTVLMSSRWSTLTCSILLGCVHVLMRRSWGQCGGRSCLFLRSTSRSRLRHCGDDQLLWGSHGGLAVVACNLSLVAHVDILGGRRCQTRCWTHRHGLQVFVGRVVLLTVDIHGVVVACAPRMLHR